MKNCINCRYFVFDTKHYEVSISPISIRGLECKCYKDNWEMKISDNEDDFRGYLKKADKCKEFETDLGKEDKIEICED